MMTLDLSPLKYATRLSVDQCLARIECGTARDDFLSLSWPSDDTILSEVRGVHVKLYARRWYMHNADPYFSGQFIHDNDRTYLSGRFVVFPIAAAAWVGMQLLLLAMFLGLAVLAFRAHIPLSFVLCPLAISGSLCLVAAVSWVVSEGQRTQVKNFIEQELEAVQLTSACS